ncbi:hypothetical protein DZF91_18205 [Actinomadura logoneensis]|uniref:Uncharacterized protein n=1 Tax=Actinomadura logoneensis TaxID=2293572 RepID=A0A372JJL4_9ACTN|nr:hypothetical protein DZF91_18205 [Actinomadura logoneensis]
MAFWGREDIQRALACRDVADLLRLFLDTFAHCTQTQLALLTQHDRSDISNWIRGVRQGRVSDIEVLTRIADGLQMPDQARLLLGLAPTNPEALRTAQHDRSPRPTEQAEPARGVKVAICGSRAHDTDASVINAAIRCLARLVMSNGYQVSHGPVGVGIEVVTYIADQYRPPEIAQAFGLFGHRNVIHDAEYVLVLGGAAGTQTEIDLALAVGKKVIPLPGSGGTARRFYHRAAQDPRLRSWISEQDFTALNVTTDPAEDFVRIVEQLITNEHGDLT